ncbi:MAG: bifunctional YncE family protein/alkaline phosphatase family protein, partial [Bacteroidota bacterium]
MKYLLYCSLCLLFYSCSPVKVEKTPLDPVPTATPLLPNGQGITPAGRSILTGDMPLGLALSRDKKTLVVVNSGYFDQTLSIVNVKEQRVKQQLPIRKSWMGAVWGPFGDYFFVGAGNDDKVYRYGFQNDSGWFASSIQLTNDAQTTFISPTGLTIDSEGEKIYAVSRITPSVYQLNAFSNTVIKRLDFRSPLYTCVLDEQRKLLYISVWGGSTVAVVQSENLSLLTEVKVGNHPSAMVMDSKNSRLFVTNSGENTVSVIDLRTLTVDETIDVALIPNSPIGSTPNALALGNGDSTLYVALADNNAIAVVDVRQSGKSRVNGFIPTGWYPTAVVCTDSVLIVANGKGESSGKNFNKENPFDYLKGTISFIPLPTSSELTGFTTAVKKNNPYTREQQYPDWTLDNPIPKNIASTSPIKHVFYIVKELRSYDDLFGDMDEGNGDAENAKYGKKVAVNHQSLAQQFVLMDNFYANGQTSANGMHWSLAAYSNDYVEKTAPTLYGKRGGEFDYEKDGISTPKSGFLWDAAQKKNISIRNYGMFLNEDAGRRGEIMPMAKGLFTTTSPFYRGFDLNHYDTARASAWMKEFDLYEKGDSLPALSMIRLPNDHTQGKFSKIRTQNAFVADNDAALGMIVERISKSKYWKESAIFILETSANGGIDHVDAHRSAAMVVSPYAKRRMVDSTHYSTASALRTIELILGIPPMTQYDAGAVPMYRA